MERQQAGLRICLRIIIDHRRARAEKGLSPQWPLPTHDSPNLLDAAKPSTHSIAKWPCFADGVVVTHGHGVASALALAAD